MAGDGDIVGLVSQAADAYRVFVAAREKMNAAIPDPIEATRAERALYDERYKADHQAQREHQRTAIVLGQHAEAILAEIARLRTERDEAVAREREECARVAEAHADDRPGRDRHFDWNDGYMDACRGAAAAIRARRDEER